MSEHPYVIEEAAVGLAAVACVLAAVGGPIVVRSVVVAVFVLATPGFVLTRLLRMTDALLVVVVSVGASVAVTTLLATAQLAIGWWQPTATVVLLALLTAGLALASAQRAEVDPEVAQ